MNRFAVVREKRREREIPNDTRLVEPLFKKLGKELCALFRKLHWQSLRQNYCKSELRLWRDLHHVGMPRNNFDSIRISLKLRQSEPWLSSRDWGIRPNHKWCP